MSETKGTENALEGATVTADLSVRKSVLITGAAGYIGAHVVKGLAADRGDLQTIVATDVREVPVSQRIEGVMYETLDVRSEKVLTLLKAHAVDTVVHLASIVSPGPDSSRAFEYSVDVEGTRNVLKSCLAAGVKKLVLTSSGAAYGYWADNAPYLDEGDPIRGNETFAYSHHKRLVEEMLATWRVDHPELEQLIFRPGTVLGANVKNQITALFEKPVVIGFKETPTPFVFIWDQDVVAVIVEGVHSEKTGIFNLAGDGVMTMKEIAKALHKPYVALPTKLVARALGTMKRHDLTRYGPEQVDFLAYRPVLSNERLKTEFGFKPRKTSREVFDLYRKTLPAGLLSRFR